MMYQFNYKTEMFNKYYINYFVLFNSYKTFEEKNKIKIIMKLLKLKLILKKLKKYKIL